jgi:hypothetical protein
VFGVGVASSVPQPRPQPQHCWCAYHDLIAVVQEERNHVKLLAAIAAGSGRIRDNSQMLLGFSPVRFFAPWLQAGHAAWRQMASDVMG